MKAVIQRVSQAEVRVDGKVTGSIGKGLLVFVCALPGDDISDSRVMAAKIANMRIFRDENDKMNLSVLDVDGEVLVVSQFTLGADIRKGTRPSFCCAMSPDLAEKEYENFLSEMRATGVKNVEAGIFGADMKVSLLNDGPVTILADTAIWNRKKNDRS